METRERLLALRAFLLKEVCAGRLLKAPGERQDMKHITLREPTCHIGYAPARILPNGQVQVTSQPVLPSILLAPAQSYWKGREEERFDRYNGIHRPKDLSGQFTVQMLFSVYEPGVRLPGFTESLGEQGAGADMSLLRDGTEEGVFTLTDWIDDAVRALYGAKLIPGSDLMLEEKTVTYSPYMEQNYIADRRPEYYGFVNAVFACYADEEVNPEIAALL